MHRQKMMKYVSVNISTYKVLLWEYKCQNRNKMQYVAEVENDVMLKSKLL